MLTCKGTEAYSAHRSTIVENVTNTAVSNVPRRESATDEYSASRKLQQSSSLAYLDGVFPRPYSQSSGILLGEDTELLPAPEVTMAGILLEEEREWSSLEIMIQSISSTEVRSILTGAGAVASSWFNIQ